MYVGDNFDKIYKIGIVGIKGKTTTAKLIIHLLEKENIKGVHLKASQLFGDNGNETFEFDKLVEEIEEDDIRVAVFEISTVDLEKSFINNIEFDSLIHTNTSLPQLEINYESYLSLIKMKPFKLLSSNGTAIINIDDKSHLQIIEGLGKNIVIPYGFSSKATLTASSVEAASPNLNFTCCLQRGLTNKNNIEVEPMEFPVNIQMEGNHNIQNSLAAIAQVLLLGVQPETISNTFADKKKYSL